MKQLRNVSKLLVALVLLINASSLFVGCNQPNGSGSNGESSENVVLDVNGQKVTFSNFDKSKRSAIGSGSIKDPSGVSHSMSYTIIFNADFTTVTLADVKEDGELVPVDPSDSSMMLPLVNGVATVPIGLNGETVQIDFNPVINKLK